MCIESEEGREGWDYVLGPLMLAHNPKQIMYLPRSPILVLLDVVRHDHPGSHRIQPFCRLRNVARWAWAKDGGKRGTVSVTTFSTVRLNENHSTAMPYSSWEEIRIQFKFTHQNRVQLPYPVDRFARQCRNHPVWKIFISYSSIRHTCKPTSSPIPCPPKLVWDPRRLPDSYAPNRCPWGLSWTTCREFVRVCLALDDWLLRVLFFSAAYSRFLAIDCFKYPCEAPLAPRTCSPVAPRVSSFFLMVSSKAVRTPNNRSDALRHGEHYRCGRQTVP